MKRYVKCGLFAATVIMAIGIQTASASAAGFNKNRIIDDVIFDNANSMNAAQIDAFLNTFPYSCISTNSGFLAIKPTGYNPSDGYQYGGPGTAGEVISIAAKTYGLNPQVLLVTLQKEQSLVAGGPNYCNDGDQHKYAAAVGYGCPDSGGRYNYSGLDLYRRNGVTISSVGPTCVNSAAKAGFSQQVIRAAWLLKFGEQRSEGNVNWAIVEGSWDNTDDPQSCYSGPMTEGTFQRCPSGSAVFFDGFTTIDGEAVHMDTGATAALYWYTPHFHGNENFFNLFTSWFGATTTNGFIWQPQGQAVFTDHTMTTGVDQNRLLAGQRYFAKVQVKNIGTQTWNQGNVRIGTSSPNNRISAFHDWTWISGNRPVTLVESSVAPGGTGTFEFWITANKTGWYKEYFNLLSEGVTWMNDMGLHFVLNVDPVQYTWQPQGQAMYTDETKSAGIDMNRVTPGTSIYNVVTIRNNGNVPWYRGQINLATSQPRDRSSNFTRAWMKFNRPATLAEAVVQPGQNGTFEFWTIAPNQIGTFKEYFVPVVEGRSWMTDYGLHFTYTVNKPTYLWVPVSQNAYTDDSKVTAADLNGITPGSRFYMTVTVRNESNNTWQRGRTNFGTSQPNDRISPFRDGTWFAANRPATMAEDFVAPGQNATFGFWVTAPTTPGNYKEYYNLVSEGRSWMRDMGLHYQIKVQ